MQCRRTWMVIAFAAAVHGPVVAQRPAVVFSPGMLVTHSTRIRPGHYVVPAGDSVAMTIRGSGIIVDLTGVELIGNPDREHPDRFTGSAIRIDGGHGITVQGLHARGFKVGIIARRVTRLALIDNDLSYNWRPRLYSGVEKESLIDWLDYHDNEHDEWLRYGAGIYLVDATIAEIKGNTVRNGMDGLMLMRSTGVRVWNNDFSFNSGVGIGLYRSSRDYIMHNRIDWNVRGYSDGFYNRGQDSAGLLMYEQSCNNIVAYNSVTHSGDGLFIWAGQSTMDSGTGGVNDNLIYHNDFSFAPTNGMEATFSRNAFVDNRVEGSWHGLWGGYSYSSVILGNHFAHNIEAISVEHGQDNRIVGNIFDGDTTAIHLWASPIEPSDWGYPRHRDTRSRDYVILGNTFRGNRLAMRIDNTRRVRVDGNALVQVDSAMHLTGDTTGWSYTPASAPAAAAIPARYRVPPLPGGMNALAPGSMHGDRTAIIVDAWGPYDGKSPKLWPVGRDDAVPLRLRVLGPPGRWRVTTRDGIAALSADSGRIGDTITVTPAEGREGDFHLVLAYRGAAVVTAFGERIAAGKPVPITWRRFVPEATWHVKFVPWDSVQVTRTDAAAVTRALAGPAVATLDTNRLDLTWYAPPSKAIPQTHVLTEATATLHLSRGRYLLRTISDDAIRVYIDDRLVLDDWTPGESHMKETSFQATGEQRFRVEHLQINGWYELRLDVEPMELQQ